MTGPAVIGSCGSCGAVLPSTAAGCDRCEALVIGPRPTTPVLLANLTPVSSVERTLAIAVDLGLVLLTAVPLILGATGIWPPSIGMPFGLVLVVGVAITLLQEFRRTGRTPGTLVTRTRYVDKLNGTPPGSGRWPGAQIAVVDLGERRPAAPAASAARTALAGGAATPSAPRGAPGTPTRPPPPTQQPGPPHRPSAVLTDGTHRIEIASTVLLGRRPRPQPNEAVGTVVELTDPTRSVSATHALLDWDGATLWLVDRGSTNGSWVVRADGARERARTGVPLAVPAGCAVQLGNRSFRVEVS
ncbi:FHA domain-containing protein [Promicromonospora sp. NPDC023987]|uniref:FHA domain-containing protein n=1 Tax=Promicromonospora sp. NPDC023987 TaxID=3155360 RepID=UPI0033CD4B01